MGVGGVATGLPKFYMKIYPPLWATRGVVSPEDGYSAGVPTPPTPAGYNVFDLRYPRRDGLSFFARKVYQNRTQARERS